MNIKSEKSRPLNVLVVDAGGPSAVFQMEMLDLMLSKYHNDGLDNLPNRPSGIFDVISASGIAGKLVAILFAVLDFTVSEMRDLLVKVFESGFYDTEVSSEERLQSLRLILEEALTSFGMSTTSRLYNDGRSKGCKFLVPLLRSGDSGPSIILHNPSSPANDLGGVTIIDAALSTCSSLPLFLPYILKQANTVTPIISADRRYSNPFRLFMEQAIEELGREQLIGCILNLGTNEGVAISPTIQLTEQATEFFNQLCTGEDKKGRDILEQIGNFKIYHRFSVPRGFTAKSEDSSPTAIVKAYMEENSLQENLHRCLRRLRTRRDTVSLYKLGRHLGFSSVFFIDGASEETICDGLTTGIRSLGINENPKSLEEALQFLTQRRNDETRLVILDGVDDPKLDLKKFIPSCDHGFILVTSCNHSLGTMYPDTHNPILISLWAQ
ncbi:hypothetical protein PIIN_06923 [Serendipita indica DSM 11827]|uniref:PNPLA domain-containing protein n=1 Tax=Serendipita indica (strain DSM 11827) TaxID=1109443 RepID=G4TNR5_SERID|nr:hypothetical protein PIIN_06923 [Serendipita indica DSM 11827]